MKKVNILISIAAIFFGFFVFTTSLIMASQGDSSNSDKVSKKTLYFGRVLPDHSLYPVLMVFDKGLVSLSSEKAEISLRIKMAQDRMVSSQMLLEKGNEPLALSTMTKSQKYLILAAQNFLQLEEDSPELKIELITAFKQNTSGLKKCQDKFTNINTTPINDLIIESDALITILENHSQK